jgi:hypothetical protein
MTTEVIYPDGSISEFREGGATIHSGELAIHRLRLITAKSALGMYVKTDGRMEMTRGGAQMSIENVIAPLTGKKYKRSMNGKREALEDCLALLAQLEESAVVWTDNA